LCQEFLVQWETWCLLSSQPLHHSSDHPACYITGHKRCLQMAPQIEVSRSEIRWSQRPHNWSVWTQNINSSNLVQVYRLKDSSFIRGAASYLPHAMLWNLTNEAVVTIYLCEHFSVPVSVRHNSYGLSRIHKDWQHSSYSHSEHCSVVISVFATLRLYAIVQTLQSSQLLVTDPQNCSSISDMFKCFRDLVLMWWCCTFHTFIHFNVVVVCVVKYMGSSVQYYYVLL
jgi:hypothetical protein